MERTDIALLYRIFLKNRLISTDSRNIPEGALFFALKGPSFDGNTFALQALEAGASMCIVDDTTLPRHEKFIFTDDVLATLQELAGYHRKTLGLPVVAITGSNGKTTTKELIHAVLSTRFRTTTTRGNLNNHIGIPLTLLGIPDDAEMAVVEMGANHQQEIAGYCTYAQPDYGLITNCGKAHLEGFGGVEGIRKGKGELFDFLSGKPGPVFACRDFAYFEHMLSERNMGNVVWYGTVDNAAIQGIQKSADPFLVVEIVKGFAEPFTIETRLVGDYNIFNVLAAVSIGQYFGVSAAHIKSAIEAYTPDNSRSQLTQIGTQQVIMDAYNANPSSMAVAIRNFAAMHAPRKVLMLGAMAELGAESVAEHAAITALISRYSWEEVILVGGDFGKVAHPFRWFATVQEAKEWWEKHRAGSYSVLLKGSRSMAMEKMFT